MNKYKLIVFAIFIIVNSTFANTYEIQGLIKDSNNDPVTGATIRIENTTLGSYADKNGKFIIKNLPSGEFDILITAIGYKATKKKINIDENEKIDVILEESSIMTDPVVVTGTRKEKLYEDSPVKISVISQKVFETTSSMNIQEGLNFQPGLRIENTCQNCGPSAIRINGLDGHYSQVLIDGKAIFSSLHQVYGLEQIPSIMIDRIEVVRGGGSSLYGGNAIAGIVNIITKEPTHNSLNLKVNQSYLDLESSNNNVNLSASLINDKQNFGGYIFGYNQSRNAYDANGDGFSEIANLDMTSFGSKIFYKPNHTSRLGLEYHLFNDRRRGGNKFNLAKHLSDITEAADHNIHSLQVNYESFINNNNKISLYTSGQLTKRNTFYGTNETPDAYGITNNNSFNMGFQYNYIKENLAGNHILTTGAEYNNDFIEDVALAYNRNLRQTTETTGFYIQDDWEINKHLNLVFGSRFDKHNLIDDIIVSPRLNAMYKITDNVSLRGNFSTGFRAPQAFDEDLHIAVVGGELQVINLDDNLKEERSSSIGFSIDNNIEIGNKFLSTSIEYFHTNLKNAFILEDGGIDANGNQLLLKKNGQNANVSGLTFETQYSLSLFSYIKAGITYQSSLYEEEVEWTEGDDNTLAQSSDKILRTPNLYGYFNATFNVSKSFDLYISGVYTGRMYVPHYGGGLNKHGEIIEDELVHTNSFFELNGKMSYTLDISAPFTISLGVHNILNQFQNDFDYGKNRDAGYIYGPLRPRTPYIEISTTL